MVEHHTVAHQSKSLFMPRCGHCVQPVCSHNQYKFAAPVIGERYFLTCDSRVSRDRRHHRRQQQQDSTLGMGVSKGLKPQRRPRSRGDGSYHGAWWRSKVRPSHPVGKTRFIPQWRLEAGVTWGQDPSVGGLSFQNMCTHRGKAVEHKTTTFDHLSVALPHKSGNLNLVPLVELPRLVSHFSWNRIWNTDIWKWWITSPKVPLRLL